MALKTLLTTLLCTSFFKKLINKKTAFDLSTLASLCSKSTSVFSIELAKIFWIFFISSSWRNVKLEILHEKVFYILYLLFSYSIFYKDI